jgi:translation initiation factor 2 beta subunit (eIF-2beta)/eIF-5
MPKIAIPNNSHTIMDPSYRYQRDMLLISKSGQYFIMDNLDLVCQQIKVDKADIIRFIPKHLKQSVKMFGDKVGVKVMSESAFETMLEQYINNNIICTTCKIPEIEMNKTSERYMFCNSCGHNNGSASLVSVAAVASSTSANGTDGTNQTKGKKSAKELKKEAVSAKKQAILDARNSKASKLSLSKLEVNSDSGSGSDSESE